MNSPTKKARHPQGKSLDLVNRSAPSSKLSSKHFSLVKTADEHEAKVGIARPTDEQLARINEFTRSTKTADDVVVHTTLSMNDLPDRDDDVFTTDCVKGFASLPQPFSPVGKSFLVDHDHKSSSARGRIFGADFVTLDTDAGPTTFLRNEIYIPNTPQNADFLEDIDLGVNWAVSVGVMIGGNHCSVCDSPFLYPWFCSEGHDKGFHYDPTSDAADNFGWPIPCSPDTKGAVKCLRVFDEPKDFYELSQVFLGAQYFASLEKGLSLAKSASGFASVSEDDADTILRLRREPKKVSQAREMFTLSAKEDGVIEWTDDHGIAWTFDPGDPDGLVLCMGRDEDADISAGAESDSEPEEDDVESDDEPDGSDSSHDEDNAESDADDEDDAESDADDEDDAELDGESEEDDADKSVSPQLSKLASKLANTFSLSVSNDDEAVDALKSTIEGLQSQVSAMKVLSDYGAAYIAELRASALSWYTKANMTAEQPGVRTAAFEKTLDLVGNNVELLKEIVSEQKEQAQHRFPSKVRRSSVSENEKLLRVEQQDLPIGDMLQAEKVSRLHR